MLLLKMIFVIDFIDLQNKTNIQQPNKDKNISQNDLTQAHPSSNYKDEYYASKIN